MNYLYSYVEFIDFLAKDKEITIISNYKLEEDERLSNLRELFVLVVIQSLLIMMLVLMI